MGDNGYIIEIDKETEKELHVFSFLEAMDIFKDSKNPNFTRQNQLKEYNLTEEDVAEYEPNYRGLKLITAIGELDLSEKDYEKKRESLLKEYNMSEEKLYEIYKIYEEDDDLEYEIESVGIDWEIVEESKLSEKKDAYFYAISHDDKLLYIGIAYQINVIEVLKDTIEGFEENEKQDCSIWLGFIEDIEKEKINNELLQEVEHLLIYENQPKYNAQYKDNYSGKDNIEIFCAGTIIGEGSGIKRLIRGAKCVNGNVEYEEIIQGATVWIFQGDPKRYDFSKGLLENKIHWLVNQHKDSIKKGHYGLIWMSGKQAGIYALAKIESDPQLIEEFEYEKKYWFNPEEEEEKAVRVELTIFKRFLDKPILRETIMKTSGLGALSILRAPQRTNFPVTDAEWEIISKMLGVKIKD